MAACSRSAWPVASTASSFLILITGALLASNFVLPPLPFQRLVAHRTARAASRGFLLFNAEENQKEKFMLAKLFDLINELPKEFAALDWQPPDSRGTRYFNAMDNKCVQYFAAGREESWSDALKNNFRSRGSGDLERIVEASVLSQKGQGSTYDGTQGFPPMLRIPMRTD